MPPEDRNEPNLHPARTGGKVHMIALHPEGTAAMPRRSSAFFETLPHVQPSSPIPRLSPPTSMSEAARKVFLDLVMGSKPDAFQADRFAAAGPLCEASALADRAEAEIAPSRWSRARPARGSASWGRRPRPRPHDVDAASPSPQARAPNNPGRGRATPLAYYERMDFEKQLSDEDSQQ